MRQGPGRRRRAWRRRLPSALVRDVTRRRSAVRRRSVRRRARRAAVSHAARRQPGWRRSQTDHPPSLTVTRSALGLRGLLGVVRILNPTEELDAPRAAALTEEVRGLLLGHLDNPVVRERVAAVGDPPIPEQPQPGATCHNRSVPRSLRTSTPPGPACGKCHPALLAVVDDEAPVPEAGYVGASLSPE